MVEQAHLNHAPIKEALIDIKVRGVSAESLVDGLPADLSEDYPRIERINVRKFNVQVNESKEVLSTTVAHDTGFRAFSRDGLLIVQFREDGFTLSRLPPYETWENLREEARRLWIAYLSVAKPQQVTRVALRYINQIDIPLPMVDFDEYLAIPPILPSSLPQGIASFLMRYVIPAPDVAATAIVTQTLQGSTGAIVPIILDIDVFCEDQDCSAEGDECWSRLDALRKLKNKIFFECVTEKTKGMYK